ncbi:predicted protein [Arabidopsis lyrata subsp. lyrata]|uniref:Predicted protein n=1 Tax=Arabidopsis lyrata subsp. lyrata TaxID=81972 RepID=D7MLY7_ARALL|nr:uncharacterized protein LOC9299636 isoform X1 [Arabidopsis lyrata subsp. lyrata]EFH41611.1 predicted protein [Arabidopsis lyrata subsp. lyrata]|eukprot:XP_002865352.1 uncharacterized protein LOC9299636 isoform X1 [Arabidopsis lyrata subsp. lyrata]
MGKKFSSQLRQILVLVMLLIVFPCVSQSAPLSVTGFGHQTGKTDHTNKNSAARILYQSAKPARFKVKARGIEDVGQERTHSINIKKSGRSVEKTHQSEGRRLSIYFPKAGIRAGPSKSGQGGGRIPVAAP